MAFPDDQGITCQWTRTHNSKRRLRRGLLWAGHLHVSLQKHLMESAYFIVLLAAVASFGLGMLTTRNWIAVGVPAVAPMAFTVVRMSLAPNPGMGEAILFVSPFLIGGTILYAFICYWVVKAGRGVRASFGRSQPTDKEHTI